MQGIKDARPISWGLFGSDFKRCNPDNNWKYGLLTQPLPSICLPGAG